MKNIFIGIISLIFLISINGCSSNTDPEFRIKNESTDKANMKIQTAEGNKISINDIEPGQTTEYHSAPEGNITTTAVLQNESISFLAVKNFHYTIMISSNKPLTMHIDK